MQCPKCQAELKEDEFFCTKCGHQMKETAEQKDERLQKLRIGAKKAELGRKARTGRGWILAVAIIMALGGLAFYFPNKSKFDSQVTKIDFERLTASQEARDRHDRELRSKIGMNWEEFKQAYPRWLTLAFIIVIAIVVIFFGLWIWAKSNPFPAVLTAFLLYAAFFILAVIAYMSGSDPNASPVGLILPSVLLIGLLSAVMTAYRYRKMIQTQV